MDGSVSTSSKADIAGRVVPRKPVPTMRLSLLDGGTFDLSARAPHPFSMIVFYHGLNCRVCTAYLRELELLQSEFVSRRTDVLMARSNTHDRAATAREQTGLCPLAVASSLPIPVARQWTLYASVSRGRSTPGIEEPHVFSEPGVFEVKPDAMFYWANLQTAPFARPHSAEVIQAFDLVPRVDSPARGED